MANENNGSGNPDGHFTQKKGIPRWIIWGSLIILIVIPLIDRFFPVAHKMSGKMAPNIVFSDSAGKQTSLSNFRGSTVLVNFWASWCGPCMEEMPALRELEQKLEGKKFIILAINVEEQPSVVQPLVADNRLPKNLFFSPTPESIEAYDVHSIPISLLLDRSGEMKKAYVGPRNWLDPAILSEIESLVN